MTATDSTVGTCVIKETNCPQDYRKIFKFATLS